MMNTTAATERMARRVNHSRQSKKVPKWQEMWMTAADCAEILGMSETRFLRWVCRGDSPFPHGAPLKIGVRWHRTVIDKWCCWHIGRTLENLEADARARRE